MKDKLVSALCFLMDVRWVLFFSAWVFCLIPTALNKESVKENSARVFESNQFEVIGYQGYSFRPFGWFGYGGAHVWYTLKKIPDNGILYEASLQRWGDEYHIYNLKAKDAIKP